MALVVAALVLALAAAAAGLLWALRRRERERGRAAPKGPVGRGGAADATRVACRILFVTSAGDDLVLDCVAVHSHPSRSEIAPGAPFSLRVGALGSMWFGDAMETFVRRLASEDRVVACELATGPDGVHVDVRSASARMRFDVHDRVGLN